MKTGQGTIGLMLDDIDDTILHVTAALQLDGRSNIIQCLANTATDSYTVTLPPVGKYPGLILYIEATIANSKAVTVEDLDGDAGYSDLTLDANGDHVVLFCTGTTWRELLNGIA